ncbi:MAG: hypothetical protein IPL05_06730, partial [Betaproteobacteria bacterium]|nr:hypothetical protein [Betaproteobacteria bacterium]
MRMAAYDWPGNVRELKNFVERSLILSAGLTWGRNRKLDSARHRVDDRGRPWKSATSLPCWRLARAIFRKPAGVWHLAQNAGSEC